jgi:hypothetical protein
MITPTPKSKSHFQLSNKERLELKKLLHPTSDAAVCRRAEAILALGSGESPSAVAKRLLVSRQVLYK